MPKNENFGELISPYLKELMRKVRSEYGEKSREYNALYYQYISRNKEKAAAVEQNAKHYEAGFDEDSSMRFMERLYKRQATVDMTLACAAHCRYCLRQNYNLGMMTEEDMSNLAMILSKDAYLREVLITGGDPLLVHRQLIEFMDKIISIAPNIRVIRIGSRLPVQAPDLLSDDLCDFWSRNRNQVKFEAGIQINHAIELTEAARTAIQKMQEAGVLVYAQNVLLKHVNDDIESLIDLYENLRYLNVESHYLFHPVPIEGTHCFRMSLSRFCEFAKLLTASGEIPGRSKPMFSLMTDIGKVTLYQGCVGEKNNGFYDIATGYQLLQRQKWHTGYRLPDTAYSDADGFLHVRYLDGED